MAPKPDLVLTFGLVLAMALVVLAITTWADSSRIPMAIRLRQSRRERRLTELKIGIRTEGQAPRKEAVAVGSVAKKLCANVRSGL